MSHSNIPPTLAPASLQPEHYEFLQEKILSIRSQNGPLESKTVLAALKRTFSLHFGPYPPDEVVNVSNIPF